MRSGLAFVTLLLMAPLAALAQQVPTCGAIVTQSIALGADLICSGTALAIEGSGIMVDLAGHTVSSEISESCCAAPIVVNASGSTIRNGRIVRTGTTGQGIFYQGGSHNTFRNLVLDGGGLGLYGSATVINNTFIGGAFIRCLDTGATIENNTFVGGPNSAIAISARVCGLYVRNNSFSGYGYAVNSYEAFWANVIIDNNIEGGGIYLEGTDNDAVSEIRGNHISAAPSDGIIVTGYFADPPPAPPVPILLAVSENVIVGSGGAGLRIINRAGDEVTVSGNLALGNVGLGINAPDVIDGGGNRAGGNGDLLQCIGVVCTSADPSLELGMCLVQRSECEDALGMCNGAVIGINGDFNGDGEANVVDSAIFRRWLAGFPVP